MQKAVIPACIVAPLALLLGQATANATTRYLSAYACYPYDPTSVVPNGSGQLVNINSSSAEALYCPVLYGSDFSVSTTSTVTFYGYQHNATDISLSGCRTYAGGGGESCTSAVGSSSTQAAISVTVPSGAFNNSGDYYYVYVSLGHVVSGSDDVIFGIAITS